MNSLLFKLGSFFFLSSLYTIYFFLLENARSGKSGNFPSLRGKESMWSFALKYNVNCGFIVDVLYETIFISSLLRVFIMNRCQIFFKCFFSVSWYDHVVLLLQPVNTVKCMNGLSNIELALDYLESPSESLCFHILLNMTW